jgi:hypothetical protein
MISLDEILKIHTPAGELVARVQLTSHNQFSSTIIHGILYFQYCGAVTNPVSAGL